ncbi:MAG: efflux RND transporter periplasmic adaptor subunit, partial [Candidatus Eisenbacteria bacterium]|nr:efflux RND transporter periplasmic adaptor subunit [Candidatus Eisenbacteria bacterium]
MNRLLLLALAACLLSAGCQKAPADPHAGHGHADSSGAAADAEPAALAPDMCAEHGVLEAMCTLCSPGLVPAYQAKGDFCAEHQLPESVCPLCHPERGGRPVNESEAPDGAPADRSVLTFRTLESARDAGLRVSAAEPGNDPAGVTGTATIVVDAAHRALVHAPAAGVVRAVNADVGARVAAGAPLARIESAAVAEARALLSSARARYDASRAAFARESTLHRSDLASAQDELAARQELEAARSAVASASSTLQMYGALGSGSTGGEYLLRSPIAGVVTQRAVALGSMVDTQAMLFEVVNANALWADIDVPETQASYVRVGQRVVLRVRELAGREVGGKVEFVSPSVDEHTRTLRVR